MLTATTTTQRPRLSFGLKAILLVHLDAHPGQWLSVANLAEHGQVPEAAVQLHLEDMVANGLVRVQRHLADGPQQGEIAEAMAALGEHV